MMGKNYISVRLLIIGALVLVVLVGCANTPTNGMGLPWWPQGPGGAVEPQHAEVDGATTAEHVEAQAQAAWVFVPGQVAPTAAVADETRESLTKVRLHLEDKGLTVADLQAVTFYLVDLDDMEVVDAVYQAFLAGTLPANRNLRPARTVVEVRRLPEGARVQISAVAVR